MRQNRTTGHKLHRSGVHHAEERRTRWTRGTQAFWPSYLVPNRSSHQQSQTFTFKQRHDHNTAVHLLWHNMENHWYHAFNYASKKHSHSPWPNLWQITNRHLNSLLMLQRCHGFTLHQSWYWHDKITRALEEQRDATLPARAIIPLACPLAHQMLHHGHYTLMPNLPMG